MPARATPGLPPDPTPPTGYEACYGCVCSIEAALATRTLIAGQAVATQALVTSTFTEYQTWLVTDFFTSHILPAMMTMTETLSAVSMMQVHIFGSFLDAKQQLETQATFQSLTADAHKAYQPSMDMCTIGTAAINLGPAYRNAEYTAELMAEHSQQRQLGSVGTSAAVRIAEDRDNRLRLFKTRYCDIHDDSNGFGGLCGTTGGPAASVNRDIDYTRTIEQAKTLDVDFSDGTQTGDEEDVMALDNNLFSHDVFERLGPNDLKIKNNQSSYLAVRSIIAKRSVAENSFFAIAGMRSAGSASAEKETGAYAAAVLQQLGASQTDAVQMMGKRPSYYALLDVLAQKIYQTPEFFVNLYDTPVNVARKDVAMQAIDLMLDRDMYKSELRTEADMATLLELRLTREQSGIQGRLRTITKGGKLD